MRFGGRLLVALSVIAVLLVAAGSPASAKASKPKIGEIAGPIAAGASFTITVDTLAAGSGATLSVQMFQQSAWRTVAKQPAAKYAGMQTFTLTAPASEQVLLLRAVLTRGKRHLASSDPSSVAVWGNGLSPASPHSAQVGSQAGEWFKVGEDELLFGPTLTGAQAWRVVSADVLVKKPEPGWSIVLGTVNYKPPANGMWHLWPFVTTEYLGGDGVSYRPGDELSPGGYCRYSLDLSNKTGDPDYDLYSVEPGSYPQFYPCAVVPDAAIAGGTWKVTSSAVNFRPAVQYAQAAGTPSPVFPGGLTPMSPYSAQVSGLPGEWFEIHFYAGSFGVLFGRTVTGEEAWNQVNGPYNSVAHPAPGWSVVLVHATLENRTDKPSSPFMNVIGPDFVGNDGVRYVGYDELSKGGHCPWVASDLFARSLGPRQSFEFTGCAVVPDSAIQGGVWQMGPADPFVSPSHFYIVAAG